MRLAVLAILAAACTAEPAAPVAAAAGGARTPTFAVTFVDTIDGAPATHLAVGGKLRVRVPDAPTWTSVHGPFAVAARGDTLVIAATGPGSGEVEIETATGYTRFAVSAAPIAHVALVRDPASPQKATVALRDASGKRLVDASLRVAPGSAPVGFRRDAWDRVDLPAVAGGDVLVKTDLLGATPAAAGPRPVTASARRSTARR